MVADVLEMVARGMDWEAIIAEWNGHISIDAIAEAVSLARQAFLRGQSEHSGESIAA